MSKCDLVVTTNWPNIRACSRSRRQEDAHVVCPRPPTCCNVGAYRATCENPGQKRERGQ
jgi:hypothetical protein